MRRPAWLIHSLALLACAPGAAAADGWQCATVGIGAAPALAQTNAGYLARAGRIYPSQLLGMVSAGGRLYLLNANDGGWNERVRQGLMELRLAEPDITAARRFHVTASGVVPIDPPAGDYVCLARERAGRHGLTLGGGGEVRLAPGRSVHLVDPLEGAIVVEVRAVGREPLDFREILVLSGRSGIYAGLAGRRPQVEAAATAREPPFPLAVAVGPAERPDAEVIFTRRPVVDAPAAIEESTPAVDVATAPAVPVPIVQAPSPSPGARAAGQSYEEYAKAMKTMLALKRSGGVRSMSEMTFVHPAVENLRSIR